ncbi:hypothetical protein [Halorarius halobius]|uniref:hypothetical protein n=1 Tax=Halorarius halobius TaxID=2962671 RepID=UPI0020CE39CA|nr:hypothetical protein [Halorarius halobius]
MRATARAVGLLVAALVCCGLVAAPAAASGDVLVVDDDGDADYATIAAAVGNASDGDTVRVRPGTYDGGVRLDDNVTVVAPDGATVTGPGPGAGESASDVAFRVESGSHAAPVVSGFTVSGFFYGVVGWNTTGDWVVRNTTFEGPLSGGVMAMSSRGDWRVENVTVRNASSAVTAINADGDWVVEDSVARDVETAFELESTTGAWTLRNVTVAGAAGVERDDALLVAVTVQNASGDWTIVDSTVRNGVTGVSAYETSGNWSVVDTRFHNLSESERYDFLMPPRPEGTAVFAGESTGAWSVRGSTFVQVTNAAIDASGAASGGAATGNAFESVGAHCVGAVDCGDGHGSPTPPSPTATVTPERPSTPTPHTDPGTGTEPSPSPSPPSPSTTGASTPTDGDGSLAAWLALAALVVGSLARVRTGGGD